ncbi:PorT family protein [Pontibacter sp. Tf4]|uniref:porin family protein n=1 Tax=Pontibacter sp. Tf4 TaxID=2761620 RepID=UPI001629361C|nr:porin family protein [Pontibacter sp. Tf4]MBB6610918.1 PorT family protein [Pontibacter sp. Tf4]
MRSFLLLTLLCLISHLNYGQVQYGSKAGVNISSIHFKDADPDDFRERLGAHAGLFAEFNLNEKLYVRPELLYSLKGNQFTASMSNNKGNIDLHYVNLPLLVGYRLTDKVAVYAGPEAGYLVAAFSRTEKSSYNLKGKAGYEDLDLGISGGVAYKLTSTWQLDARYTYGFPLLMTYYTLDHQGASPEKNRDGSNRTFQVGVSYYIDQKTSNL